MYRLPLYNHKAAKERMSRRDEVKLSGGKLTYCTRFGHFVVTMLEGVEVVFDVDWRSFLDSASAKEDVR